MELVNILFSANKDVTVSLSEKHRSAFDQFSHCKKCEIVRGMYPHARMSDATECLILI